MLHWISRRQFAFIDIYSYSNQFFTWIFMRYIDDSTSHTHVCLSKHKGNCLLAFAGLGEDVQKTYELLQSALPWQQLIFFCRHTFLQEYIQRITCIPRGINGGMCHLSLECWKFSLLINAFTYLLSHWKSATTHSTLLPFLPPFQHFSRCLFIWSAFKPA